MTKEELLNLFDSLNKLNNLSGVKFAYAVAKNINIIRNEVIAITKTAEPSEEYKIFENERIELVKKHAKKEKGEAVIQTRTEGNITIQEYVLDNKEKFEKEFEKLKKKHKKAIDEREKQRTNNQNRALHLFFRMLADILNDAGLDQKKVLKPEIDIPWEEKSIKERLWRPIQELYLNKKSTTELTTKEIDKVYEVLCRHLGEKLGVDVPSFPSIEEQIINNRELF